MLNSYTLKKTLLQPVIQLWNVCSVSEGLFLFWSVWFHQLPIYLIIIDTRVKKNTCCSHGTSKRTGSEITDSTRPKKPIYSFKKLYDQSHIQTWINQTISSSPSVVNCTRSGYVSLIWQSAWIWTAVPILDTSCPCYNNAPLNNFTLKDF